MSAGVMISFEIYLLVRGRWEIHARHDFEHRDDAIAEAQQLEREPHVTSACVVHEVYDPVENVSQESVVYYTDRSEEHTSELQSLMRISYAVFCLKKNYDKSLTCV